jgi:hypothetical protein
MVPEFLHENVNIWHCQFNIFSERLHISLQDLMFCDSQVLNQFILVHLLWGITLSMGIKTAVDTKISCEILVTTNQTTRCHDQDNHNMTTSLVTVSLDKYSYLSRGLTLAICKLSTRSHAINTTTLLTQKCYMLQPSRVIIKQECVKGWWWTSELSTSLQ